ncbi:MAG: cytochrome P450 [Pseudomonadota bacterium]
MKEGPPHKMERIRQSPTEDAFVQDPYPFYDRLRAGGDFAFWEDYNCPVAVSHRAVMAVLKERRMGRVPLAPPDVPAHSAPFYALEAHSMLELEPPRHTRLRGLVARAFTGRRVADIAGDIGTLADELIAAFPDGPFDLLPAYAERIPVLVIARLLGVPDGISDQLLSWSHSMVAMYQAGRSRAVEEKAAQAAKEFDAYMRDRIRAKRSDPGEDLLSYLIAARDKEDRLSTDELVSTCILLLNAGHEATVHTIGNGVKTILECGPLTVDHTTLDALTEEVLRFDPPLHMFTRYVYEPIELFGQGFEPGDQIACLLASAGRDPAVWNYPNRFDVTRPVVTHTAFGAGIHFCVGAPLARLELRIALARLFAACPEIRFVETPRYAPTYHFHGLERLIVVRK